MELGERIPFSLHHNFYYLWIKIIESYIYCLSSEICFSDNFYSGISSWFPEKDKNLVWALYFSSIMVWHDLHSVMVFRLTNHRRSPNIHLFQYAPLASRYIIWIRSSSFSLLRAEIIKHALLLHWIFNATSYEILLYTLAI